MLISIVKFLACIALVEAVIFVGIVLWLFARDNL